MSGVAILHKLLDAATDATVIAGVIPQSEPLPAIGLMSISERKYQTMSDDDADTEMERVQVTVAATSYAEQKAFIRLIKETCKSIEQIFVLTYGTFICKSIVREFVGPDFKDSEAGVYMQSVDFMVKYQRSS